ncbi:MAG: TetR/AcrR family transcriptional regulator [Treponema sp.]|nr:TetR/AcrR family transcriptional regulator [Treponema sp.]
MAREKDESKRLAILAVAGKLFAERGYHGTSVSDIAREIGLPVGSIYTYFENKEAVLVAVIEEGWSGFIASVREGLARAAGPKERILLLVEEVLPGLFRDADLITILLAEAGRGGLDGVSVGLDAKLGGLAELILPVLGPLATEGHSSLSLDPSQARAAIAVYFLGSLYSIRLARSAGLQLSEGDILSFIRLSIENSFGLRLES